jgi:hypothetical protein
MAKAAAAQALEAPAEAPAEVPAEVPAEDPADAPGEAPGEDPAEDPADAPGEAPGDAPAEKAPEESAAHEISEEAHPNPAPEPPTATKEMAVPRWVHDFIDCVNKIVVIALLSPSFGLKKRSFPQTWWRHQVWGKGTFLEKVSQFLKSSSKNKNKFFFPEEALVSKNVPFPRLDGAIKFGGNERFWKRSHNFWNHLPKIKINSFFKKKLWSQKRCFHQTW